MTLMKKANPCRVQGVIWLSALLSLLVFELGCEREVPDPQEYGQQGADQQAATAESDGMKKDAPVLLKHERVEVACGQCQLGLSGDGCDLAIRVDGIAYFVDGTSIDEHGDAHAEDGFCNAIREADVDGRIENGRFVAESLRLVP